MRDMMDAPAYWNDETFQLHAMINLLSMRNGGQLDVSMHEQSQDSESDASECEDDILSETETDHAGPIATSIDDKLKSKFVVRFAEILSREKNVSDKSRRNSPKNKQKRKKKQDEKQKNIQNRNGKQKDNNDDRDRESFVACACLREHDDHIEMLVTRNNGLDLKDKAFFEELETCFSKISQKQARTDDERARNGLWAEIVKYNHGRIFSHLPVIKSKLQAVLDATQSPAVSLEQFQQFSQSTTPPASNAIDDESPTKAHAMGLRYMRLQLSELYSLVTALPETLAPGHEKIRKLLDLSHSLRYEQNFKMFLIRTLKDKEAASRCLIRGIAYLGRIKAAFLTVIKAIETFSNFGKLKVIPYPPVTPPAKICQPKQGRLNLEQTLGLFALPLEENTVLKLTGTDLTAIQADATFMKLQSAELPTHAEIQMIMLIMTKDFKFQSVYPYIGCSLQHSDVSFLWQCAKSLRNKVARDTLTPVVKTAKIEATSTADVTSLYSAEDDRFRMESLARSLPLQRLQNMRALEHQLLRDRFGEVLHEGLTAEKDILMESHDPSPTNYHDKQGDVLTEDECFVCMRMTVRKCSSCQKYALCSMSCEKKFDFVRHTISCPSTKRPIDSADYLCLAVLEDNLPDDPKTCDDFGFSCFWDSNDRTNLFGLYVGLLNYLEVPSRTVARWLEKGTLTENIMREYDTLPQRSRGGYYPWFLEHRHIIEKGVNKDDLFGNYVGKIKPYLDTDDKIMDPKTCQPKQKRQAFFMFVGGLNHNHPPITREEWYLFGFCTTVDDQSERRLGGLYMDLVHRCRFTEFWQAYAQSNLIALMERKGLGGVRQQFRHLENFLSTSCVEGKDSVWDLVWFCRGEETEAPRYLLVDYGFFNCATALDRMQLKDTYKELIQKCDLLELHRACKEGTIYHFASKYMKLEMRFQGLMKNVYPLPEM